MPFAPAPRLVEGVANDWVWSLLPKKGVAYYRHLVGFWTVACWVGAKKLRTDRRFLTRNLRALARRPLRTTVTGLPTDAGAAGPSEAWGAVHATDGLATSRGRSPSPSSPCYAAPRLSVRTEMRS